MPGDDGYFDERVAARYDEDEPEMFDPAVVDPAVDFLVELAGEGRALELAIGTGRIALPLASGECRSTESTCPRRWSRGCERSLVARTSA